MWHHFKSWHSQPQLYKEVYARTVSSLIAAFVIWVLAVLSGSIEVSSQGILIVVFGAIAVLWLTTWFPLLFEVAAVLGRRKGPAAVRSAWGWVQAFVAIFGPVFLLVVLGALFSK